MYQQIEPLSSPKGIIILFLLAHSVLGMMMIFTFPRINDRLGTQVFDLKTFGYSESEALSMLQNLDPTTIDFYIFPQLLLLDILYPVLLALFLSAVMIRLSSLIKLSRNQIYSNLYLLPFFAMISDYLENVMILLMIKNAAAPSLIVIQAASILTQLKGAFTMLSWTIILVLLTIWLTKRGRKADGQIKKGLYYLSILS
jgi:hypothetical protein